MKIKDVLAVAATHDVACECALCTTVYKETHYGPFNEVEDEEEDG